MRASGAFDCGLAAKESHRQKPTDSHAVLRADDRADSISHGIRRHGPDPGFRYLDAVDRRGVRTAPGSGAPCVPRASCRARLFGPRLFGPRHLRRGGQVLPFGNAGGRGAGRAPGARRVPLPLRARSDRGSRCHASAGRRATGDGRNAAPGRRRARACGPAGARGPVALGPGRRSAVSAGASPLLRLPDLDVRYGGHARVPLVCGAETAGHVLRRG